MPSHSGDDTRIADAGKAKIKLVVLNLFRRAMIGTVLVWPLNILAMALMTLLVSFIFWLLCHVGPFFNLWPELSNLIEIAS